MQYKDNCPEHTRRRNYICLSTECAYNNQSICVLCVKKNHRKCSDQDLLTLGEFVLFSVQKLQIEFKEQKLREDFPQSKSFIEFKEQKPIKRKSGSKKDKQTQNKERSLEEILDSRIKSSVKTLWKSFLKTEKEAITESHHLSDLRLERIDQLKKAFKINLDLENKILEVEPRNSNKIAKFSAVSKFLKHRFIRKFMGIRDELLEFRLRPIGCDLIPNFLISSLLASKNIEADKLNPKAILVQAKVNQPWRNLNGDLKQLGMISLPVNKCLIQIEIRNLNFNSSNLEILLFNEKGFNYWSKKLKFADAQNFKDVPCIAKLELKISPGSKFGEVCEKSQQEKSLEMAINGCKRIVKKVGLFLQVDKSARQFSLKAMDTSTLISKVFGNEVAGGKGNYWYISVWVYLGRLSLCLYMKSSILFYLFLASFDEFRTPYRESDYEINLV